VDGTFSVAVSSGNKITVSFIGYVPKVIILILKKLNSSTCSKTE
jgi:hypothetical protein